jgi:maltose alpha-D-glucosyltransferase / alpha-amylase
MQPLWYRNAVVYQIDPSLFRDADGDGCGDLRGVIDRLDYVRTLGVTCIWLLPFYRSPFRDGGYDVTDHLAVDPRFGDLADVVALLERADELGIHVMVELVVQHTSDQHLWFQQARQDRHSPYRDYYVWADTPEPTTVQPGFPTVEDSVWTWDETAQQYYRHVFYSHEPDLNLANPEVRDEMYRIMSFWLRLGVSGFRVDAVPFMIERAAAADAREAGQWLIGDMRDFVALRRPDAVLMGEVDVPPELYPQYFGNGDRLTLLLDFWINNRLFLSLARRDAQPLASALEQEFKPPKLGQYAVWLRNHDELDLERLTPSEREEVMRQFAPHRNMRAYNRGIRRRLAPMLDGDERRLAMLQAVLFSLPGTPVLRYGDEIGMGDDLSLPERLSVRTPMQWSDGRNAGFSDARDASCLVAPVISGGRFGYERINAYEQMMRTGSLLQKSCEMARVRTGLAELGFTACVCVPVSHKQVLALRHGEKRAVLMLANLGADDVEVEVQDGGFSDLVDLLSDDRYEAPQEKPLRLRLKGYGYRWLRSREDLFG